VSCKKTSNARQQRHAVCLLLFLLPLLLLPLLSELLAEVLNPHFVSAGLNLAAYVVQQVAVCNWLQHWQHPLLEHYQHWHQRFQHALLLVKAA
jgi:hypothetical protein